MHESDFWMAQDKIDRLQAEVKRLEAEIERLRVEIRYCSGTCEEGSDG